MALSRVHTWSAGEVLTASDLNAEYNNILNNPTSLIAGISPSFTNITASGGVDAGSLKALGADFFTVWTYRHQITSGDVSGGLANIPITVLTLANIRGIILTMDTADGSHVAAMNNSSYFSTTSTYTTTTTNLQVGLGASATSSMFINVVIIKAV